MNLWSVRSAGVFMAAPIVAATIALHAAKAQQEPRRIVAAPRGDAALAPAEALLARPISIDVHDVSLRRAIGAVETAAGVRIGYQRELVDAAARQVTVRAVNTPMGIVMTRVLAGTGLRIIPVRDGQLALVPDDADRVSGGVSGTITDAETKRPIAGATISVDGTRVAVTSQDDGTFRISGLSAGTHRISVQRLGYRRTTETVQVKDGETVTLSVALAPAPTRLTEVVTTAAGDQRRLEVGNVISRINADSIAKTAPVLSLTDLLSARSPGVQVVETNGLVGAGPSIRIRGQSSLVLAGDPIIIVDGIRQDNTPGGKMSEAFGYPVASPNRLNDLDFSQIETIDILKGPAASTEYGTDAANGVIVITTKRGKAGKPRWRISGEQGWSEVPVGFPEYYYGWGHLTDGSNAPVNCTLTPVYSGAPSLADQTCSVDSVTHYNPLNDKNGTIYGTGMRQKANIEVSGGSEAIRYYLGAGVSHDLGTTKLPNVFKPLARNLGFPESSFEPSKQTQRSVRGNLFAQLAKTLDVSVNSAYLVTRSNSPSGTYLMYGPATGNGLADSTNNYGYGHISSTPLVTLGQLQEELTSRATLGITADWRPTSWFSGRATVGIDHGSQRTRGLFLPQAVASYTNSSDAGTLSITNAQTDLFTGDVRGSVSLPLSARVRSLTSVGFQVATNSTQGVTATVYNLTESNTTLNGVPNPTVSQMTNDNATVGGYLEQQVGISERLFLTGALRLDAGSGFGGDYHATVYPKLSVSWLAHNSGGHTLRLRSAFGAAGVQPANGAAIQLYRTQVAYLNGQEVTTSVLSAPGNPNLKPERSQEFEGGLDLGLWDSRVNLEVTSYVKHTKDALVNAPLGWTFNNASWQENLGDIRNSGTEVTLQAVVLQTARTTWDVTINTSMNRNKLLSLAPGVTADPLNGYQRHIVGYPLYGVWGKRVTYADANGDSILDPSEVTVADSQSYLGSSLPRHETSVASQLSLFGGKLAVGTLFDYRSGGLVFDGKNTLTAESGGLPEQHYKDAPLSLQARAVAHLKSYDYTALDFADGSFLRWRELSVTYAMPQSWIRAARLSDLSVTVAVRNLGLWTPFRGDPEVSNMSGRQGTYQFNTGTYAPNADLRGDFGGGVPLSRSWVLRFNTGL